MRFFGVYYQMALIGVTFSIALTLVAVGCYPTEEADDSSSDVMLRLETVEHCQPGDRKTVECNWCRCHNGRFACTHKTCPAQELRDFTGGSSTLPLHTPRYRSEPSNEPCVEGTTQQKACNKCTCRDGRWSCSEKACIRRHTREVFSCTPGQTFMKDCNTCSCTPDGENAICSNDKCEERRPQPQPHQLAAVAAAAAAPTRPQAKPSTPITQEDHNSHHHSEADSPPSTTQHSAV